MRLFSLWRGRKKQQTHNTAFSSSTLELPLGKPPQHVAIIMDGNSRWARLNNVPVIMGHRKGAEAAREIVRAAGALGIRYLTLYAFSSENWLRSSEEVTALMELLRQYLTHEVETLHENKVCLKVIGNKERLEVDIQKLIMEAEAKTASNEGLTLVIAISYGGREELTSACRQLAERILKKELLPKDITEQVVESTLYTAGIPSPDILIRTSGEQRLSNFLLWQVAYAELYFTSIYWPDFNREEFIHAIKEYNQRERRFGHASTC